MSVVGLSRVESFCCFDVEEVEGRDLEVAKDSGEVAGPTATLQRDHPLSAFFFRLHNDNKASPFHMQSSPSATLHTPPICRLLTHALPETTGFYLRPQHVLQRVLLSSFQCCSTSLMTKSDEQYRSLLSPCHVPPPYRICTPPRSQVTQQDRLSPT